MKDIRNLIELRKYNQGYLDVTDYPMISGEIIGLPSKLIELEEKYLPNIFPSLYKDGVYLSTGRLVIAYNLEYNNGKENVYFNNINDFDNYFINNQHLYLTIDNDRRLILDRELYNLYRPYMTDIPGYRLTDAILEYINTVLMYYINEDAHLILHVDNNSNKMSNIILHPLEYIPYHALEDVINSFKHDERQNHLYNIVYDVLLDCYHSLYEELLTSYMEGNKSDSVSLKRVNKDIVVKRFLPVRYRRELMNNIENIDDYLVY